MSALRPTSAAVKTATSRTAVMQPDEMSPDDVSERHRRISELHTPWQSWGSSKGNVFELRGTRSPPPGAEKGNESVAPRATTPGQMLQKSTSSFSRPQSSASRTSGGGQVQFIRTLQKAKQSAVKQSRSNEYATPTLQRSEDNSQAKESSLRPATAQTPMSLRTTTPSIATQERASVGARAVTSSALVRHPEALSAIAELLSLVTTTPSVASRATHQSLTCDLTPPINVAGTGNMTGYPDPSAYPQKPELGYLQAGLPAESYHPPATVAEAAAVAVASLEALTVLCATHPSLGTIFRCLFEAVKKAIYADHHALLSGDVELPAPVPPGVRKRVYQITGGFGAKIDPCGDDDDDESAAEVLASLHLKQQTTAGMKNQRAPATSDALQSYIDKVSTVVQGDCVTEIPDGWSNWVMDRASSAWMTTSTFRCVEGDTNLSTFHSLIPPSNFNREISMMDAKLQLYRENMAKSRSRRLGVLSAENLGKRGFLETIESAAARQRQTVGLVGSVTHFTAAPTGSGGKNPHQYFGTGGVGAVPNAEVRKVHLGASGETVASKPSHQQDPLLNPEALALSRLRLQVGFRAWRFLIKTLKGSRKHIQHCFSDRMRLTVSEAFSRWRCLAATEKCSKRGEAIQLSVKSFSSEREKNMNLMVDLCAVKGRLENLSLRYSALEEHCADMVEKLSDLASPMVIDFRQPIVDAVSGDVVEEGTFSFRILRQGNPANSEVLSPTGNQPPDQNKHAQSLGFKDYHFDWEAATASSLAEDQSAGEKQEDAQTFGASKRSKGDHPEIRVTNPPHQRKSFYAIRMDQKTDAPGTSEGGPSAAAALAFVNAQVAIAAKTACKRYMELQDEKAKAAAQAAREKAATKAASHVQRQKGDPAFHSPPDEVHHESPEKHSDETHIAPHHLRGLRLDGNNESIFDPMSTILALEYKHYMQNVNQSFSQAWETTVNTCREELKRQLKQREKDSQRANEAFGGPKIGKGSGILALTPLSRPKFNVAIKASNFEVNAPFSASSLSELGRRPELFSFAAAAIAPHVVPSADVEATHIVNECWIQLPEVVLQQKALLQQQMIGNPHGAERIREQIALDERMRLQQAASAVSYSMLHSLGCLQHVPQVGFFSVSPPATSGPVPSRRLESRSEESTPYKILSPSLTSAQARLVATRLMAYAELRSALEPGGDPLSLPLECQTILHPILEVQTTMPIQYLVQSKKKRHSAAQENHSNVESSIMQSPSAGSPNARRRKRLEVIGVKPPDDICWLAQQRVKSVPTLCELVDQRSGPFHSETAPFATVLSWAKSVLLDIGTPPRENSDPIHDDDSEFASAKELALKNINEHGGDGLALLYLVMSHILPPTYPHVGRIDWAVSPPVPQLRATGQGNPSRVFHDETDISLPTSLYGAGPAPHLAELADWLIKAAIDIGCHVPGCLVTSLQDATPDAKGLYLTLVFLRLSASSAATTLCGGAAQSPGALSEESPLIYLQQANQQKRRTSVATPSVTGASQQPFLYMPTGGLAVLGGVSCHLGSIEKHQRVLAQQVILMKPPKIVSSRLGAFCGKRDAADAYGPIFFRKWLGVSIASADNKNSSLFNSTFSGTTSSEVVQQSGPPGGLRSVFTRLALLEAQVDPLRSSTKKRAQGKDASSSSDNESEIEEVMPTGLSTMGADPVLAAGKAADVYGISCDTAVRWATAAMLRVLRFADPTTYGGTEMTANTTGVEIVTNIATQSVRAFLATAVMSDEEIRQDSTSTGAMIQLSGGFRVPNWWKSGASAKTHAAIRRTMSSQNTDGSQTSGVFSPPGTRALSTSFALSSTASIPFSSSHDSGFLTMLPYVPGCLTCPGREWQSAFLLASPSATEWKRNLKDQTASSVPPQRLESTLSFRKRQKMLPSVMLLRAPYGMMEFFFRCAGALMVKISLISTESALSINTLPAAFEALLEAAGSAESTLTASTGLSLASMKVIAAGSYEELPSFSIPSHAKTHSSGNMLPEWAPAPTAFDVSALQLDLFMSPDSITALKKHRNRLISIFLKISFGDKKSWNIIAQRATPRKTVLQTLAIWWHQCYTKDAGVLGTETLQDEAVTSGLCVPLCPGVLARIVDLLASHYGDNWYADSVATGIAPPVKSDVKGKNKPLSDTASGDMHHGIVSNDVVSIGTELTSGLDKLVDKQFMPSATSKGSNESMVQFLEKQRCFSFIGFCHCVCALSRAIYPMPWLRTSDLLDRMIQASLPQLTYVPSGSRGTQETSAFNASFGLSMNSGPVNIG